MGGEASPTFRTALVPGFRFHPTDEELVGYYLKRKVCRKPFRLDAIAEIDIYKFEPWDLPSKSRLKTRDLQWYFFSVPDKKYGNGSKTSRATEHGYWKTTGKDRSVRLSNRTIGLKKTLVYHIGRAPRGERTNWVMHEYRLVDENLVEAGVFQDAFVLCRIFQKSGPGPRNCEQYGAPFVEEDWDEEILVREMENNGNAFFSNNDDGYIQESDLDKHLELSIPSGNVLPLKLNCEDAISHKEDSKIGDNKKLSFGWGEKDDLVELSEDQDFFNLPEPYWMGPAEVKDDYFVTLNDLVESGNANYHVDDPVNELNCLHAAFDSRVDDGSFLEFDDLAKPFEADQSGLEMFKEYLACLEVVNEKSQYVTSDSSKLVELEDPVLIQSPLSQEQVNRGKSQEFLTSPQHLESLGDEGASLSKQNKALPKPGQDVQHSEKSDNTLLNWASHMLHCIPSSPSLASEIPTKKASIGRSSATHSTSSIHVTTGMMQLGGIRVRSYGNNWSLRKNEDVNIMLSYGTKNSDVMAADHLIANSFESISVIRSIWGKAGCIMVRSGFYLIFLVLISASFKVGTYLYTS